VQISVEDVSDATTEQLVLLAVAFGKTAVEGGGLSAFLHRTIVALAQVIDTRPDEPDLDSRIRLVYHRTVVDASGDLLIDGKA
jgi:hypothetical protein